MGEVNKLFKIPLEKQKMQRTQISDHIISYEFHYNKFSFRVSCMFRYFLGLGQKRSLTLNQNLRTIISQNIVPRS